MSESKSSGEQSLQSQRVPIEREVVLEFEHFSSFINEYSANISLGGMFVRTDEPRLPESIFNFQVRLADDDPLISGLAKVLWVRETDDGVDRPSGMGVRFLQLEEDGRGLIERVVREHLDRGGEPFDLEAMEEEPETRSGPVAVDAQPQPEPSAASTRSTGELPALEELLKEARTPTATLPLPNLDTPPRGWKPGIRVARPRTRPQLIGAITVAALLLGGGIYLLARLFSSVPLMDKAETEPVPLPRMEESAEAEAPPLPPFTTIEEINWRRAGNAAEIVVRLDGSLPERSWSVDRLSDPPRHLFKLMGASRPYPTQTFEVGFGGVRQLRTGYHDTGAGNEQHVVIDLNDPRVVLEDSVVDGAEVRLRFRRLGP